MKRLIKYLPGQFTAKPLNDIKQGDLIAIPRVTWTYFQVLSFEVNADNDYFSKKPSGRIYASLRENMREDRLFIRSEIEDNYLIVTEPN